MDTDPHVPAYVKAKVEEALLAVRCNNSGSAYLLWLKTLELFQLEALCAAYVEESKNGEEVESYLQKVKENETIEVCSRCHWSTGCERCSYEHAMRYVLRWGKPAAWWNKTSKEALLSERRVVAK